MAAATRRRFTADQALCWRRWGDEMVVHAPLSSTTHLLDAFAGDVLQALRDAPHALDADALWVHLPGADRPDDNARLMLDETLQRLAQVGLAVAIDP
jgi:PqqD family protein of HPr-rel-A system